MTTLILLLILAAPCRAAKDTALVESPTGKPLVEASDDPLSLEWRAQHCSERGNSARQYRSEAAAFDLLPCLSHPSAGVRWRTLEALDKREYFLRPDFGTAILPKLRLAVEYSSQDQDVMVRQSAGALSRDIQTWEATESPQAKAGAEQFRKDERKRFWRDSWKLDRESWGVLILLAVVVFIVWVLPKFDSL
jgi:hypothetical protein